MIVAITGATGFIGKRLVQKHLALKHKVRFLTRNPQSLDLFDGAEGHLSDLAEPNKALYSFVEGADVIYHLAAELQDEALMWKVNVKGTQNLLDIAQGKVGRWVQLSSTGVYGAKLESLINEQSILRPNNLYEKSKTEADRLVTEYSVSNSMPAVILRPSNVYGADMPNQSLFQLISIINRGLFFYVGKKGSIVNYVHVDNVIDALMLCASVPLYRNPLTYIVSDYCTIEELVEIIAESLDKPYPKLRFPETVLQLIASIAEKIPGSPLKQSRIDAVTGRVIYSSKSIATDIGYCNRISIKDGFKEMVDAWIKRHD
ncbi:MAG: NAD-dependent epimerase/dehydratase family protein [Methylotenera sp.]|uniref:NAD-dependent epimerase/dehydratase family protein n=1 Tax=Methylotenera sp. TaxID=2051956 RepID=UPI002489E479|nr:NAD-dependent epimerase/dehydratase family protein [Methylotenera sp.]MDI1307810.1 NAD-dependent epimerase/dehydratase family protein [Methylotenera sp.]